MLLMMILRWDNVDVVDDDVDVDNATMMDVCCVRIWGVQWPS